MKSNEKEEPKVYFERNLLLVAGVFAIGLALDALTIYLFSITNPLAMAAIVPALIVNIQAVWLTLNPYVIVYDNRFMIKRHILSNPEFYYLDIKSVNKKAPLKLELVYNDDDKEGLSLIGIKNSHVELFKEKLTEKINESIEKRGF